MALGGDGLRVPAGTEDVAGEGTGGHAVDDGDDAVDEHAHDPRGRRGEPGRVAREVVDEAGVLGADGLVPSAGDPSTPDYGATVHVVLALWQTGEGKDAATKAATALASHVDAFVVDSNGDNPANLALLENAQQFRLQCCRNQQMVTSRRARI